MVDTCEKLNVHTEATIQVTSRFGDETHRELTLEHEDSTSEDRSMLKKLEY